jgi:large subunit ribosomal protein L30
MEEKAPKKEDKTPQIKVTQVRSASGRKPVHRRTIRALGLHRVGQTVVHRAYPQIKGMIKQVEYLLEVEEVKGK